LGRDASIDDSIIHKSFALLPKKVLAASSIPNALCQYEILFKYNSNIFSFDTLDVSL
jgi:hypothetical protein